MGRLFLGTLLALCMPGLAAAQSSIDVPLDTSSPTMPMPLNLADRSEVPDSTADHTLFEILHRDFQSGPEVTEACLSCHTSADEQVMHSVHFQWDYTHPETGQELGKSNVINAFCGHVGGHEPR